MQPIHPNIKVRLTGRFWNAFAILGAVSQAMRRAGCSKEQISAFYTEATAGDYNALLATAMKYVDVR